MFFRSSFCRKAAYWLALGFLLAVSVLLLFNNRRLAGAGGTHQKRELAVLDLHRNTPQRLGAYGIRFYNISKLDHIVRSKVSVTKL